MSNVLKLMVRMANYRPAYYRLYGMEELSMFILKPENIQATIDERNRQINK